MTAPTPFWCHVSPGSKLLAAKIGGSSKSGDVLVLTNICLTAERPATLFLHTPSGQRLATAKVSPASPCSCVEVTLSSLEGFAFEAVGGELDLGGFIDREPSELQSRKARREKEVEEPKVQRGKVQEVAGAPAKQQDAAQPSKPPAQNSTAKDGLAQPNGALQSKSKEERPKAKAEANGAAQNFIPAKKFEGSKPGMVFKKGSKGLGYYKDTYVPPAKGVKRKSEDPPAGQPAAKAAATLPQKRQVSLPSGLKYEVVKSPPASAQKAKRGRTVQVRYDGRLASNGKRFDKGNIKFRLGAGEVIRGWDLGVDGMQVGEKRKLMIPAPLGYGRQGAPPSIPPNAALAFEVELMKIL